MQYTNKKRYFKLKTSRRTRFLTWSKSWLGVNVIVNSSDVAQVKIYAISPEGQTVVTLERNFTGTPREISEIASFDPANINGQKEGNWTLNYEIIGGPVNIKIEKVSSFGTPQ